MGLLKGIFDDVVDIATAPVRLAANVVDKIVDDEDETLTEGVKDMQKAIKGE